MDTRQLGRTGPTVSALGLGLMGMSDLYGPADEAESIATIHAALDAGVTLLDTGDFYGMGHNELLLRDALRGRNREAAVISVKFGALRDPDGGWAGNDVRPAAVKNFVAYSLRRLGTDHIDIYRPSRIHPDVPVEDTIGAIAELIEAGHVRHIGLSEVGADTLRRAAAVHPISDLQIEYSLISRGIEQDILPTARELGIGVTAYGVLSRGLLSGRWSTDRQLTPGDFRGFSPRFQGDNLTRNLRLVESLRGARTRARLAESLGATGVQLTEADIAAIESAVPTDAVAGDRYAAELMAGLDSER
jgi:aryl-alcohol dehydrogenase-like predicted oxidoreductase